MSGSVRNGMWGLVGGTWRKGMSPPALPPQREIDPVGSTTPMPEVDTTLHLSPRTVDWLADHPHARRFVRSVWDTLTELQRSGQYPGALDALRRVLIDHQPTASGRCRICRRWMGRHRRFPCTVWHQIRGELFGLFPDSSRRHQPEHDSCHR